MNWIERRAGGYPSPALEYAINEGVTTMRKSKGKTLRQRQQAMQAESKNAADNTAYTKPTYHKDMHEPNRPSV